MELSAGAGDNERGEETRLALTDKDINDFRFPEVKDWLQTHKSPSCCCRFVLKNRFMLKDSQFLTNMVHGNGIREQFQGI